MDIVSAVTYIVYIYNLLFTDCSMCSIHYIRSANVTSTHHLAHKDPCTYTVHAHYIFCLASICYIKASRNVMPKKFLVATNECKLDGIFIDADPLLLLLPLLIL